MAQVERVLVVLVIVYGSVQAGNVHEMEMEQAPMKLVGFKWRNCDPKALITLKNLNVTPDPIEFGGLEKIAINLNVAQTVGEPNQKIALKLKVEVKQSKTQYDDLCRLDEKLCNYDDVCQLLSQGSYECPEILKQKGIDCKCPLKQGGYKVDNLVVKIPQIPSAGFDGEYRVTANFLMNEQTEVGCFEIHLCVNQC